MDLQKEREVFEAWLFKEYPNAKDFMIVYRPDENIYEHRPTQVRWEAWQAAKAQAVPETQQAINDRLLVESIREHVEGHISEISVNDLFDKGWLAAMKCIKNNIDMLEAQEQTND